MEADAGAAWVHGVDGNPLIEDGWIGPEDSADTGQNLSIAEVAMAMQRRRSHSKPDISVVKGKDMSC